MKQISEAIQKREDLIKGNISSQFQLRQLDDEFEKGKSLPIGTIREHGGKKKQKKADGSWVPVSGKKEKRETVTVGGRDYGVKTFDSVDEANKFMEQNKEWGVIEEHGGKIYVAKKKDMGEKRDSGEVKARSSIDLIKEGAERGSKEIKVKFEAPYNEMEHGHFRDNLKETLKKEKVSTFNILDYSDRRDIIGLLKNPKDVKEIKWID